MRREAIGSEQRPQVLGFLVVLMKARTLDWYMKEWTLAERSV